MSLLTKRRKEIVMKEIVLSDSQKVIPTKHYTSRELLEIFHNLGSANDKILAADPKLGV